MNIMALLRAKSTVAYIEDTDTVRQGLEKIRVHGYTAIPVIREDGSYAGTITEGDFLWHILETESDLYAQENYRISEIIRKDFNPAARIDIKPEELLKRILQQNFIPMVDDRNLFIGIITRQDVIRFIQGKIEEK
ncbi:MAG: CBS domain-containing protein [Clostridia bacterium]|nr:CBS domain-containing protein [Clostridia bacterium]